MNAYKFNSTAGTWLRLAISNVLKVPHRDVYAHVRDLVGLDLKKQVITTKEHGILFLSGDIKIEESNFVGWLEDLPLQTLTDELKQTIIDKYLDSHDFR